MKVARVISTGSSLALSALPHAALRGIPAHYIESVTRTDGYSMSGRILQRVPGISLYAQWPHLATHRWRFNGSVLDGFESVSCAPTPVRRIVVSVGTSTRFGFRRLLEQLRRVIPSDVEVIWQSGSTDVSDLGIEAQPRLPAQQLEAAIRAADVVVAHAGAGIALTALQAGKLPLLAPRLTERGEHIDDHQVQIATHLSRLGLAVIEDAGAMTWQLLASMTSRRVAVAAEPSPFLLHERTGRRRVG